MIVLDSLTDEELLNLTLKKIDKLRLLSNSDDIENIRKTKAHIHILIKEVKRRDIKLNKNFTAKRILKEY